MGLRIGMRLLALAGMAVALSVAAPAWATTVTAHMTVDNYYSFYISTDDSIDGTPVGSDLGPDNGSSAWQSAETWSATLTPSVTNYLHVRGQDFGVIAGFLGDFTLSDADFAFGNGSQTLLTNATDWKVYRDGFGVVELPLDNIALNGGGVWGGVTSFPSISSGAQWIWTNGGMDIGGPNDSDRLSRYFSAPINFIPAIKGTPVPEPLTVLAIGLGVAGLGRYFRRRQAA